jgi:hypothetical protein
MHLQSISQRRMSISSYDNKEPSSAIEGARAAGSTFFRQAN